MGNEDLRVEILTVPLEAGILGNLEQHVHVAARCAARTGIADAAKGHVLPGRHAGRDLDRDLALAPHAAFTAAVLAWRDRKSTRLNSSHPSISYAVFCLKKKKHNHTLIMS